ncbi:MerR family transcriptional regulator [Pseudomonas sp. TCU-HL1]|nr:MerR family transcriptional regulator [Pseudomonas sp. TCU-HL1]
MGLSLAECRDLIEMYELSDGKSKQAEMTLVKIAEKRVFLERQILEINQLAIELDGIAEHFQMIMNGHPDSLNA